MHPPIDLNMSLQAFQAKYTSEDNASFNDVLDSQNFAKAKKIPICDCEHCLIYG